ncbi:MAG: TRAP transporter large permease subunit [Myxococcota bacterium]|nr:TRAP transporter large permease subunit [Myxococcota bacterium]MDW8361413.1 TRAP transporter large permease subunit [Myxococcales bacterium]
MIAAAIAAFALIGAPLFAVFGLAALGLFGAMPDTSITGVAQDVFSEKFADSPLMVTIPLFTVAGYLMAESGTPRRLVELSRAWLGWLPGGLAVVCLGASAFFTTFTGGSGITIVAIGGLLFPALLADRYRERYALGLVTTGGSLGLLFPPSLPIVLYAVVAGVMIEKLFLAGLLPGMLVMLLLAAHALLVGLRDRMERTPFRWRPALRALWHAKWEVALPLFLMGGLLTGTVRIHEAAAFTAIYALIVEVFVYKDLSLRRDVPRVMREAVTMFGAILVILATAIGFTAWCIQAQVPMKVLEAMEGIIDTPVTFLLALNAFLLVVGMLMDVFSAIVVVVPLVVPIAAHFGVDPYHLGIVFLLNLEIGYLTPPVGLNLFISAFRFGRPMTAVYRAVLPFIGLLLIALAITTYVPWLSTSLTGLVRSEEIDVQGPAPPRSPGAGATGGSPGPSEPGEGPAAGNDAIDLDALERLDDLGGDEPSGDVGEGPPSMSDEPTLDDLELELGTTP